LVEVDPRYFRPTEVELLVGDATKARETFGWQHEIGFEALVEEMMRADVELFRKEKHLRDGGYRVMDYNE